MSRYEEQLSDGGLLVVFPDDWFIQYVDWPRLRVDFGPDRRFKPSFRELNRKTIERLVATLTLPWITAETARDVVLQSGTKVGVLSITLSGGYHAQVDAETGVVRVEFPDIGWLQREWAEALAEQYVSIIARAEAQQRLLTSLRNLSGSNPAEIAKWEQRIDDLVRDWSTRRSPRQVLVKLKGQELHLIADELRTTSANRAEVSNIKDGPNANTVEVTVEAPSMYDAERYVSLLLTVWGHKTSLLASASR